MHRLPSVMASLLAIALIGLCHPANGQDRVRPAGRQPLIRGDQRVVIAMIDGFGTDYLASSDMPALKGIMARGFSKTVRGVMPSVTNVNNASIACAPGPRNTGSRGTRTTTRPETSSITWRVRPTSGCRPSSSAPRAGASSRPC